MAAWLKLYSKLSSKTWIGVIGVKGSHTAAAKIENVFPNDEDDENLMYLQSRVYTSFTVLQSHQINASKTSKLVAY